MTQRGASIEPKNAQVYHPDITQLGSSHQPAPDHLEMPYRSVKPKRQKSKVLRRRPGALLLVVIDEHLVRPRVVVDIHLVHG